MPQGTDVIVIGAGVSGATCARQFAEKGYTVTVFDKRDHIGGNCYDYINTDGFRISQYGPHFFHTNSERVWNYVNRFGSWLAYNHKVLARVGEYDVPVPVNYKTVETLYGTSEPEKWLRAETALTTNAKIITSEDVALQRVGSRLYEAIFKPYTKKQWDLWPYELDSEVLSRIPVRYNYDESYFSDIYQGQPKDGFTSIISAMLDHPNIHIETGVDWNDIKNKQYGNSQWIVYTGPVDSYFTESTSMDLLEYRSMSFELETVNVNNNFFQCNTVINYPSLDVPWTRITEYKHIPWHPIDLENKRYTKSTIAREYSSAKGDPYYPIPNTKNKDLYQKYKLLADKETHENNVLFVGRLATYKYYNMDQAILSAIELMDSVLI